MLRNIRLLYIHNFLTDFLPQWPYLVIYLAAITGSYTIAMSMFAVETLSSALMDIPTGVFSDRVGRRYTIALGSLCGALGIGFYAAAYGLPMLYAGAFFTGLSQCLFSGNNNALLYESLKAEGMESQYHHYRGGTASMYQLALCLSAFAAMFLSRYGLRFIYIVAIVPQILAVFVSLMFIEPPVHITEKQKSWIILKRACIEIHGNPKLLLLVLGKAVNYGVGEAGFKFKTAFINLLWSSWAVGLYRGLDHAFGFIGYRAAGYAIEHIKPAYIFVLRDLYWLFTNISALVMNNIIAPLVLMTGALVFGPGEVASDHLMQIEFTHEQRATMGSLASSASSVVFALAALGIGAVSDRYGIYVAVAFIAVMQFTSLPVYVWLFRKDF